MSKQAEVRYLAERWRNRPDRPFIYSRDTRHANTVKVNVDINCARQLLADGDLDFERQGFTLSEHDNSVTDYNDAPAVKATYASEIEPLLTQLTGAEETFVMHHQLRTENPETFLGAYSRYVHCDYPLHPVPERERSLLMDRGSLLAGEIQERHYAWYNIWEAVDRPAEQNQLCLVDADTAVLDDFREYHFSDQAESGYATLPLQNPTHRFYYFDRMQPGEALVFKQYDSRTDLPKVCPHTSFFDSSMGEVPGRRSVEFRALCVFGNKEPTP